MKKNLLLFIFVCFTLSTMAQEDVIRVNYKGAKPTITDFAWAYLFSDDEDECDQEATAGQKHALENYRKGLPQNDNVTFTVDEKNGYILYEDKMDDILIRTEMCYWNESDGKHKLFAYSSWVYSNGVPLGGQYDYLVFLRYNNATIKMTYFSPPGFEVDGINSTYALPRVGKDIIVYKWDDKGIKTQKTLKWNGRRFSK